MQGFSLASAGAVLLGHQPIQHGQFRQFVPPLLSPKRLASLIDLHQLLHRALMEINVDFHERAVEQLMEVYERSQALWAQEWRDELSELPMLNRLVA